MDLVTKIQQIKKEKNAVILAHYYTVPEVQDLADCLGDSLALAQFAQKTDADVIVFAGVYFMAETAKILNPSKKVFIPDVEAACSLSDSCPADKLARKCKCTYRRQNDENSRFNAKIQRK